MFSHREITQGGRFKDLDASEVAVTLNRVAGVRWNCQQTDSRGPQDGTPYPQTASEGDHTVHTPHSGVCARGHRHQGPGPSLSEAFPAPGPQSLQDRNSKLGTRGRTAGNFWVILKDTFAPERPRNAPLDAGEMKSLRFFVASGPRSPGRDPRLR